MGEVGACSVAQNLPNIHEVPGYFSIKVKGGTTIRCQDVGTQCNQDRHRPAFAGGNTNRSAYAKFLFCGNISPFPPLSHFCVDQDNSLGLVTPRITVVSL